MLMFCDCHSTTSYATETLMRHNQILYPLTPYIYEAGSGIMDHEVSIYTSYTPKGRIETVQGSDLQLEVVVSPSSGGIIQ